MPGAEKGMAFDTLHRPARRGVSVRTKIVSGFLIFVGGTILLLELLQLLLFPYLYGAIRLREIREGSRQILTASDGDSFYSVGKEVAERTHSEVLLLLPESSSKIKFTTVGYPECLLYELSYDDCLTILDLVQKAGGTATFSIRQSVGHDGAVGYEIARSGSLPGFDGGNLVEATYIEREGVGCLLLVNGYLTPVDAASRTMSILLLVAGGLMALFAVILASYISNRIAGPIVKVHDRAERFAQGRYEPIFDEESGYREVRELSATLNQAAVELSKVDHLRNELIANISHDLRTPLTLISGYSEMMRDIPGEITSENLGVILQETERLSSLVNDLLETSKIQSGNVALHCEPIDLSELLRGILETYTTLTEREGYKISLETSDSEDVTIVADRSLLVRAVQNLVNNAMTYTGADRRVVLRQLVSGDCVRIEVQDSGAGIAPDQLDRIWDRYYRVDAEHKRAAKGTGLGLSIVKSIVVLHHGNYGVRSRLGQGSTFWIEFPLSGSPQEG